MAIYKNVAAGSNSAVVHQGDRYGSNLTKMSIANTGTRSTGKAEVDVYFDDGTDTFYLIKGASVHPATSLVLEDCLKFDKNKYTLYVRETGGNSGLSVIIV